MKKQNSNQVAVNAAFKENMNKVRADGGIFTQKKAATVALPTLSKLKTDDDTEITLSAEQKDIITAMFYPTVEWRMKVIESVLKTASVELDANTMVLIKPLLNPAGVQKKLEDLENPENKNFEDFLN